MWSHMLTETAGEQGRLTFLQQRISGICAQAEIEEDGLALQLT